jgi:hypothetical protein
MVVQQLVQMVAVEEVALLDIQHRLQLLVLVLEIWLPLVDLLVVEEFKILLTQQVVVVEQLEMAEITVETTVV